MSKEKYSASPFPSSGDGPPIDPRAGLKAAEIMLGLLKKPAVIGGGLAMMLYGSTRATKDVAFYATGLPRKLPIIKKLSFGGNAYKLVTETEEIPIDVIVRNDGQKNLYKHAIKNGKKIGGYPVPSPEHLAIIKYFAGRPKDQFDLRFLLSHNLFSEKKAKKLILTIFPGDAGKMWAEDFEHDMIVKRLIMSAEKTK